MGYTLHSSNELKDSKLLNMRSYTSPHNTNINHNSRDKSLVTCDIMWVIDQSFFHLCQQLHDEKGQPPSPPWNRGPRGLDVLHWPQKVLISPRELTSWTEYFHDGIPPIFLCHFHVPWAMRENSWTCLFTLVQSWLCILTHSPWG